MVFSAENYGEMTTPISRADLIRLDAQDGAVDGTVTEDQLIDFNQQFAEEAGQKHLFDENGRLDYGHYLDAFAKGWSVWKDFTENPENIPLLEAIRLGQKTGGIRAKISIPSEKEETFAWQVSAELAYRTVYFFPKRADRLWQTGIERVVLTDGNMKEKELPIEIEKDYGSITVVYGTRLLTKGEYSSKKREMQLPIESLSTDTQTLSHEMGHVVWNHGYDRSLREIWGDLFGTASNREKTENIIRFFHFLVPQQFEDVFGSDYGHPDSNLRRFTAYDPVEETHAALASLTELGFYFPEIIRDRLEEKYWSSEDILDVYEQLAGFREIIKKEWGFGWPPSWVESFRCYSEPELFE